MSPVLPTTPHPETLMTSHSFRKAMFVFTGLLALSACGHSSVQQRDGRMNDARTDVPPGLADGEMTLPDDYRSWPVYLAAIDKPDSGQIRDIYLNPIGDSVSAGEPFPHGSISVMEIWKAKVGEDGKPLSDAEGRLLRDDLSLVFVMAKSRGAGDKVAPELRNGDWVYSGFAADGKTPAGPPASACRTCHLKASGTDWMFRVDEYLANRSSVRR